MYLTYEHTTFYLTVYSLSQLDCFHYSTIIKKIIMIIVAGTALCFPTLFFLPWSQNLKFVGLFLSKLKTNFWTSWCHVACDISESFGWKFWKSFPKRTNSTKRSQCVPSLMTGIWVWWREFSSYLGSWDDLMDYGPEKECLDPRTAPLHTSYVREKCISVLFKPLF